MNVLPMSIVKLLCLEDDGLFYKAGYKKVVRDIGVLADVVIGYYNLLLIWF